MSSSYTFVAPDTHLVIGSAWGHTESALLASSAAIVCVDDSSETVDSRQLQLLTTPPLQLPRNQPTHNCHKHPLSQPQPDIVTTKPRHPNHPTTRHFRPPLTSTSRPSVSLTQPSLCSSLSPPSTGRRWGRLCRLFVVVSRPIVVEALSYRALPLLLGFSGPNSSRYSLCNFCGVQ